MTKNGQGMTHYREPMVGAKSVCRTCVPLPSELEAPKVNRPVDVSRVCYVSA